MLTRNKWKAELRKGGQKKSILKKKNQKGEKKSQMVEPY